MSESKKSLPDWYPQWAQKFADLYFSKTTNTFVLHGNTDDLVRGKSEFKPLTRFLTEDLFGTYDLILYYDLSKGIQLLAGKNQKRLQEMHALTERVGIGDLKKAGRDPAQALNVIDQILQKNVMLDKQLSIAVILGHASFLARRGKDDLKNSTNLVTLLNWATSPYLKRNNTAILLLDNAKTDIAERLVNNPHVASLEIPLPEEKIRHSFLASRSNTLEIIESSDYSMQELAKLTAGISLTDLTVLVNSTVEAGERLNADRFRKLKKMLIERQANGLLEFIEPRWGLDMVVGHEAAKNQLRQDAALLAKGALESIPMGYLLCGPVGTGKSFLAVCCAGELGIPCVKLKNFRSKYVGETEANLERVLNVLRSMGPVLVFVDEADAMLGDRKSSGDSGTSSRIFGMIAQQMGDTRYRGKILWMLATTRPDLLPIDLKRQGRAEIHIPLFYPGELEEIRNLFKVMAKKMGAELSDDALPTQISKKHQGQLSGADIEGIVGRAWREVRVNGGDAIEGTTLTDILDGFIPMAQSQERLLQKYAAIMECTDEAFLPPHIQENIRILEGRNGVQQQLTRLQAIVA